MGRMKDLLTADMFEPPLPPSSRFGTSEEAAESMRESAASLRAKFLQKTTDRGLDGLTTSECARIFGITNENSVHPRFWELESDGGAKTIRKLREAGVPKELFVIDTPEYSKRITRPSLSPGKREQLVYFAFRAVSVDHVLAHYGAFKKEPL